MRVQVLKGVLFVGAVMAVAALPPMQSAAARGAAQQAGQAPAGRGAPAVNDSRTSKEELERWMTELSNSGRWGKDDQLGAANLITPAKRKQALALVKSAETVSLSHDTTMEKAVDVADPLAHQINILGERGIAV